jgi:hypothetical protein
VPVGGVRRVSWLEETGDTVSHGPSAGAMPGRRGSCAQELGGKDPSGRFSLPPISRRSESCRPRFRPALRN